MPEQTSFKTRVLNTMISCAPGYDSYFVKLDHLIVADAFQKQPYYIVKANKDNYLHLTGVSTTLSAKAFFDKCLDGSLSESDFDLVTHGKSEAESKGTIRQKIKNLPYITSVISDSATVQEDFKRNVVSCSFASADAHCTLGFAASAHTARPKSLLNGNVVDENVSSSISLCLSRSRLEEKFDTIEVGSVEMLAKHYSSLQPLLSDTLNKAVQDFLASLPDEAHSNPEQGPSPAEEISSDSQEESPLPDTQQNNA